MSQRRMIQALQMALNATDASIEDRYTAAMIRRAKTIIERTAAAEAPDRLLGVSGEDCAKAIRQRAKETVDPKTLRRFVEAKLRISNPDHLG